MSAARVPLAARWMTFSTRPRPEHERLSALLVEDVDPALGLGPAAWVTECTCGAWFAERLLSVAERTMDAHVAGRAS